jgi:hypothetical protein
MSSGVSPEIIERYSVAFTRLAEPACRIERAIAGRSIGIAGLSKEEGATAVFSSETEILRADLLILMLRPARSSRNRTRQESITQLYLTLDQRLCVGYPECLAPVLDIIVILENTSRRDNEHDPLNRTRKTECRRRQLSGADHRGIYVSCAYPGQ